MPKQVFNPSKEILEISDIQLREALRDWCEKHAHGQPLSVFIFGASPKPAILVDLTPDGFIFTDQTQFWRIGYRAKP